MPIVQIANNPAQAGTVTVTMGSPLTPGNTLLIGTGTFFTDGTVTAHDNLGNSIPLKVQGGGGGGGFFQRCLFLSYIVPTSGITSITVHDSLNENFQGTFAMELSGVGILSDIGFHIGSSTGSGNHLLSTTQPFTTADSTVIGLCYGGATNDIDPNTPLSGGGWVFLDGSFVMTIFELTCNDGVTRWFQVDSDTPSHDFPTVAAVVFSKPLPRPPGLTKQTTVRPAAGMILGNPLPQNPFSATLKYLPKIGELIIVGCSDFVVSSGQTGVGFTPSDAYGNVYTQQAWSTKTALYTAPVTALPPPGEPFIVTLAITPPGGVFLNFSMCSMSVGAFSWSGLSLFQTAVYASQSATNPSVVQATPMTVPRNSMAVAVAGQVGAAPGYGGPNPALWAGAGGFTLENSWAYGDMPGNATVNSPHIGLPGILTMAVPTAATVVAEFETDQNNAVDMCAIAFPLPLASSNAWMATES